MDDQLKRMLDMSGEDTGGKAPKYIVPMIKFNGNTGEFQKIVMADGEKQIFPLAETIKFVILKNRKKLECFEDGLSSIEYNSPSQIVTLFSNNDGKFSRLTTDTVSNIKDEYPSLKTQEILYVLMDGEICKLVVKGGSSKGFYDYRDVLKGEGLRSFQVTTEVSSSETKGKANKKYMKMDFNNLPLEIPLDKVEKALTEVFTNLQKIDDYNFGKASENAPVPTVAKEKEEDVIDLNDDIDPDDIDMG